MKYFTILLFLLSTSSLSAQISFDQTNFEFQLVDSNNADKQQLFNKALTFFATYYKSANSVIQYSDLNSGKIIGKAAIPAAQNSVTGSYLCTCYIHYTITIDLKDGKYRCILNDIYHNSCNTAISAGSLANEKPYGGISGIGKRNWRLIKETCEREMRVLLFSLQKDMRNSASDF